MVIKNIHYFNYDNINFKDGDPANETNDEHAIRKHPE